MVGVAPSMWTALIFEVSTWKISSTSGFKRASESMSEVVSAVIDLMRRATFFQSFAPATGLALRFPQEELLPLHAPEVAGLVVAKAHEDQERRGHASADSRA